MYEVYGPDRELKMQTEYAECLPIEHLDVMLACGYTFRKCGKLLSKFQVQADAKIGARSDVVAVVAAAASVTPTTKPIIVCVETGIEYVNQSAAARDLNIDPAQVSDSIKTGRKRSGYTFVRRYI